jgi:hypothetical protein
VLVGRFQHSHICCRSRCRNSTGCLANFSPGFILALQRTRGQKSPCRLERKFADFRRKTGLSNRPAFDERKMLLQTDPEDGFLHHALYRYFARKGMYREASHEVERVLVPFGDPDGAARVQNALVTSGDRAGLRQFARELEHWISTERGYFPVT